MTNLSIHIRWMIRRDRAEVLAIEGESFEFPWLEEDFIRCLRRKNCIGMVAEHDERVVGFIVYELTKTRIHILNLAVGRKFRRCGVGKALVERQIRKLTSQRRSRLSAEVRESNLPGCMFLKACGLVATQVMRDYYDDEDGYLFVHALHPEVVA